MHAQCERQVEIAGIAELEEQGVRRAPVGIWLLEHYPGIWCGTELDPEGAATRRCGGSRRRHEVHLGTPTHQEIAIERRARLEQRGETEVPTRIGREGDRDRRRRDGETHE